MTPVPQRARKPHQKAARRQAMLDAARDLMDSRSFDEIAVREIPDRLGLAKGTVYRYFGSKEEVFLSVLDQDLADYAGEMVTALRPLSGTDDIEAVTEAITACTVARPRLCQLMALLPTVLERNVSEPAAFQFKTTVAAAIKETSEAVGDALPCLDRAAIPALVVTFYSLVTGLWTTAHPHAAVASAMADPGLAFLKIDFGEHLYASLRALLKGSC